MVRTCVLVKHGLDVDYGFILCKHSFVKSDLVVRICYLAKKDIFNCQQIIFSIYVEKYSKVSIRNMKSSKVPD